jgi:hypothetical protein
MLTLTVHAFGRDEITEHETRQEVSDRITKIAQVNGWVFGPASAKYSGTFVRPACPVFPPYVWGTYRVSGTVLDPNAPRGIVYVSYKSPR